MKKWKVKELNFSLKEIGSILLSVIVLGLLFTFGDRFPTWNEVIINFFKYSFIIGMSFILHEVGHKFVAQSYGAFAEYQIWLPGLIFSMFLGVASGGRYIFFAPGFVAIYSTVRSRFGRKKEVIIGVEEVGKISLAGPAANLVLALVFKVFSGFVVRDVGLAFIIINSWLALFNLLPIPPLDGSKVFVWSRITWAVFFTASIISLFILPVMPLLLVVSFVIALSIAIFLFAHKYHFA